MKAILCLPLLFASCVWADEAANRAEIGRVIAILNARPQRIAQVAESPTAANELIALRSTLLPQPSGAPRVNVSHEPWGEATIDFHGGYFVNSMIVAGTIRFLTPDVALVDGDWSRDNDASSHKALLFVMKKVADHWKIASARMLAPR